MVDKFGKVISQGNWIVYPTRPGGKGPLQLGFGKVTSYDASSLTLDTGTDQGESARKVKIRATDRVAVVSI